MTVLRKLQIAGTLTIALAYVAFICKAVWIGWGLLTVTGVVELVVIFKYDSTITRFVRNMYGRRVDTIVLLCLIPLTWLLAGELAAGFFLLGLLNSHFHEHE